VLAAVTDVTSSATNLTNDHADAAPTTHEEDSGSALIDAPRAAIGPTIERPRRPAARDGGRRPNGATTTTTTPPNGDPPGGTPFIE
jgi:hypothetical protein